MEIIRSTIITLASATNTHSTTYHICFTASFNFASSHEASIIFIPEYKIIGIANSTTNLSINWAILEIIGPWSSTPPKLMFKLFLPKISSPSWSDAYSQSWASSNACSNKSWEKVKVGAISPIHNKHNTHLANNFITKHLTKNILHTNSYLLISIKSSLINLLHLPCLFL